MGVDELFGLIEFFDASQDLSGFITEVDLEFDEFVGSFYCFGVGDGADADMELGKVIEGNHGLSITYEV